MSAGCSRIPLARQTYESFTAKAPDADEYPTTADKILVSPYASIGAQFQGQPKVVMTLGTVEDNQLSWVSSNHLILATQNELLVSTHGLPVDMVKISVIQPSPVMTLLPGESTGRSVYRRQLTKRAGAQSEWVDITSDYRNIGERKITVLGSHRTLWLIEERADYKSWRWQVVNQYWIDPISRFAWRSRHQFTPEINYLELDVLKPYA